MKNFSKMFLFILFCLVFANNFQFNQPFIEVAKNANPSVVSIISEIEVSQRQFNPFFNDPFFEDFFPEFKRKGQTLGSGVIIDKDGYIITNNHVIDNATKITVILYDKTEIEAEIIGVDRLSDIAVIKIETENQLSEIKMGNSDQLSIGEWIVAIGSPFGIHLNHTVTAGIVSAVGRSNVISKLNYEDFIQHDAAINPGNSGGALLNLNGELVGINTAIATDGYSKSNAGVGFAIPINQAKRVIVDLVADGSVSRGWVGIQIKNVNSAIAKALGLDTQKGALVVSIIPDSPASNSSLKEDDIIIKIDNKDIEDDKDLFREISSKHPGEVANFVVIRNGDQKLRVSVKLGLRPSESDMSDAAVTNSTDSYDLIGLRISDIEDRDGVSVVSVEEGSSAYNYGIIKGDILTKIGRKSTKSISIYKDVISEYEKDDFIMIRLERNGNQNIIAFRIE